MSFARFCPQGAVPSDDEDALAVGQARMLARSAECEDAFRRVHPHRPVVADSGHVDLLHIPHAIIDDAVLAAQKAADVSAFLEGAAAWVRSQHADD